MARYPKDEFDDLPPTERKGAHRRSSGRLSQGGAVALVAVLAVVALLLVFGAFNIIRQAATDPEDQVAEETQPPEETASEEPEPEETSVDVVEKTAFVSVLNGSGVSGAGSAFSEAVEEAGWTLSQVGNFATPDTVSSIHYSDPDFELEAQALGDLLGVEEIIESTDFDDDITVVICSDIASDGPAGAGGGGSDAAGAEADDAAGADAADPEQPEAE